jgi:hypothetical protein
MKRTDSCNGLDSEESEGGLTSFARTGRRTSSCGASDLVSQSRLLNHPSPATSEGRRNDSRRSTENQKNTHLTWAGLTLKAIFHRFRSQASRLARKHALIEDSGNEHMKHLRAAVRHELIRDCFGLVKSLDPIFEHFQLFSGEF